jgi:hypothetical protein
MLYDSFWYVCSWLLPSVHGGIVVVKYVIVTKYILGACVKVSCLVKMVIQSVIKNDDEKDVF